MNAERYIEYTAHFVDNADELLTQHPPQLQSIGRVRAHHVTIEYNPQNGINGIVLGRKRILQGISYVVTSEVHALLVKDAGGDVISNSLFPHVTIATAPGVSPVVSNAALEKAHNDKTLIPLDPPVTIRTTEGYSNGDVAITTE